MASLLKNFTFDRNTLKRTPKASAVAIINHIKMVQARQPLDKTASNIIGALASYMGIFVKRDGKYVTSRLGEDFLVLAEKNPVDAFQWLLARSLWRYCVPNGTHCAANEVAKAANNQFSLFPALLGLLTQMQSLPKRERYLFHEEFCHLFNDDETWMESATEVFQRLMQHRNTGGMPEGRRLLDDLEQEYGVPRDNLNTLLNKALIQTGFFETLIVSASPIALAYRASMDPILQRRVRYILDNPLSFKDSGKSWPDFIDLHRDDLPQETSQKSDLPVPRPSTEGSIDTLVAIVESDFERARLKLPSGLLKRFIASLLTKRLVILTGLSGSGKTKLAQAFTLWLTTKTNEHRDPFSQGAEIKSDQISYYVEESGPTCVVFRNKADAEDATLVGLPRALISEWASVMRSRGFYKDTPSRQIREAVKESSNFSPQLNSFETHLKSAALALIQTEKNPATTGDSVTIVSVGADWDSNEQILGYADALRSRDNAYCKPANGALELILRANRPENRDLPFFLILDEMNLSHVERYFADFLSIMESGSSLTLHAGPDSLGEHGEVPPRLELPDNLFIIGTVNIDETTYLFSPKVLDRANTIEFRVPKVDMAEFLEDAHDFELAPLMGRGTNFGAAFVAAARQRNVGMEKLTFSKDSKFLELLPDGTPPITGDDSPVGVLSYDLLKTFDSLAEVGAEYGYRTATEIRRFFYYYTLLAPGEAKYTNALDAQVIQKLLPKLHGSVRKLGPVLEALLKVSKELNLTLSIEKLERMRRNLNNNGFTSFAEA